MVRAHGGVADDLATAGCDRLHEREIGEMRAAVIRIVEEKDVVRARIAGADRAHRLRHGAEVDGNVRRLRDHASVGVE